MSGNALLLKVGSFPCQFGQAFSRNLHSSPALFAGARYRAKKGEERHFNRHRVIADTPDWSYLDGRPAPLTGAQRKRYFQQMDYNRTIQTLLEQVDGAKAKEEARLAELSQTKQQIIANKLRSKARDNWEAIQAKARAKSRL